jgi:hypothetical protein
VITAAVPKKKSAARANTTIQMNDRPVIADLLPVRQWLGAR